MIDVQPGAIWSKISTLLEKTVSGTSRETWFFSIAALSFRDDILTLEVPNQLNKEWLVNRYAKFILEALENEFQRPIKLKVNVKTQSMRQVSAPPLASINLLQEEDTLFYGAHLNPRYTFETFVIGEKNRFAHAAALAVSEAPAKAYNPLFIYGGVGLGKTHLLHAIGHYIQQHGGCKRVSYITTERFTNAFVNAILDNALDAFRQSYRNVDVLLIDDIQFLSNKEQTQEEFFHTFNALHEADKQIVLTSDRLPKAIPSLEERLCSRFEWGLIADIYPPELETRIAILRKKSMINNLEIPDDVLHYVATQVDTNVRELEGALIRVVAYATLQKERFSRELARAALKQERKKVPKRVAAPLAAELVIQKVAEYYKIPVRELEGKKRTKTISLARHIAVYLCRELSGMKLSQISAFFDGRDHTTLLYACSKISKNLKKDIQLQKAIKELKSDIRSAEE
ncbi:MAG: hypothetical protein RLZ12_1016 [Bacillota bacterium]